MERDYSRGERYNRAQKRVQDIKQFYKHLTVYLAVNGFLILRRIYKDIQYGDSVFEALTDASNYRFLFWWGVIVVFHAVGTFGIPNLFSKDWEDRKIKEYMNKEQKR